MRAVLLYIILFKSYVFLLSAEPRYNFDVKPILSDRCYHCHGPDKEKRKGELRLDVGEGIKESIESGELIARITSTDPEERMPPPESKLSVTEEEITILKDWITAGGKVQGHWSFIPIKKNKEPNVADINHPIDFFIGEKLISLV